MNTTKHAWTFHKSVPYINKFTDVACPDRNRSDHNCGALKQQHNLSCALKPENNKSTRRTYPRYTDLTCVITIYKQRQRLPACKFSSGMRALQTTSNTTGISRILHYLPKSWLIFGLFPRWKPLQTSGLSSHRYLFFALLWESGTRFRTTWTRLVIWPPLRALPTFTENT